MCLSPRSFELTKDTLQRKVNPAVMAFTIQRILVGLAIAAVAGAVLFLPAIYLVGLWVAPSLPMPSTSRVPPLFAEAVWARANGGRADELRPVNPVNLLTLAGCLMLAEPIEDPEERRGRQQQCRSELPGIEAAGYLSRLHLRDEGLLPGRIQYAFGQLATGAWITRSWSKAELVTTLAAQAEFGLGWRGAETAARGYFARPLAGLPAAQAATLAAFIGTVGGAELGMASGWSDPWCDPDRVMSMRRRVLERMRDNLAIDDAEFESADRVELGLTDPPPGHKPCR
jgi:hypothetical protein